jgi:hypothetical protein
MQYKIRTDVFGVGRIIQELSSVDNNNQITRLSRWIINTRDEAVRQALLKLGWTPPNNTVEDRQAIVEYCEHCGPYHQIKQSCKRCGSLPPAT